MGKRPSLQWNRRIARGVIGLSHELSSRGSPEMWKIRTGVDVNFGDLALKIKLVNSKIKW
jgi:hypothetical protein